MTERHPAGRSCAIILLAGLGLLTATGLAIGHAFATDGPAPATVSPVPAAVVQSVTTTPPTTTEAAQATSTPGRAPMAQTPNLGVTLSVNLAPTTTEATPTYATDANGARVAPEIPGTPPTTPGALDGWNPTGGEDGKGAPVGPPDPAVH